MQNQSPGRRRSQSDQSLHQNQSLTVFTELIKRSRQTAFQVHVLRTELQTTSILFFGTIKMTEGKERICVMLPKGDIVRRQFNRLLETV